MLIYMFPGQGSQFPGMGKSLFAAFPEACERASDILGHDIVELCLRDPDNRLSQTLWTQPAVYFVSALAFLESNQPHPACLMGHSLGLYAALFAAGVFSLEEGLRIVVKRATLMSEAKNGGMMAVIGDSLDQFEELLLKLEFPDIDIANFNSDTQIVLSGRTSRLLELQARLDPSLKTLLLPVSGAFHSRLMKPAFIAFFEWLKTVSFQALETPVISTTHGEPLTRSHLLEELAGQLIQPVRWQQVIACLRQKWPEAEFREIGPGNVLTRLNEKIRNRH